MKMLKKIIVILCAAIAGFGGVAMNASAGQRVLVIGLDGHEQAVPSSSPLFGKVQENLVRRLADTGVTPLLPVDMGLGRRALQTHAASDANLLSAIASGPQGSPDAVVTYSMFVRTYGPILSRQIESRMQGNVLDVVSGDRLGSFDVSFPFDRVAPKNCGRDCMLEEAASQADEMARVLGRDIISLLKNGGAEVPDASPVAEPPTAEPTIAEPAIKQSVASLAAVPAGPQVTVKFDGFTSDELALIYEYVPAFEGHVDLGTPRIEGAETVLTLHNESQLMALETNFVRLLEHLDLPGEVVSQAGSIRLVRAE